MEFETKRLPAPRPKGRLVHRPCRHDPLFSATDPSRVSPSLVTFEPARRTAWRGEDRMSLFAALALASPILTLAPEQQARSLGTPSNQGANHMEVTRKAELKS